MDSTVPRSTIPVAVTVASEQEPVECKGVYSEHAGGFTLEFSIQRDKFTVEHAAEHTRIKADGVMSYDIKLGKTDGDTLLNTPYGQMRFPVKTTERTVERKADRLNMLFKYIFSSATAGEIERAVDITARFCGE